MLKLSPVLESLHTKGEMEAAICAEIARFEQEHLGRGPKEIAASFLDDLLIIRMRSVLTAAEQHLIATQTAGRGRDLLKRVRTELIESARPHLDRAVETITGTKVRSLHHDISTITGEELIAIVLQAAPQCRERKRKPRLDTFEAQIPPAP